MSPHEIPIWKKAPFIRITLCWVAGILLQYYLIPPIYLTLFLLAACTSFFFLIYYLSVLYRYRFHLHQGFFLMGMIVTGAMLVTNNNDIRSDPKWIGHIFKGNDQLLIKLEETPVEKNKSFKANCTVKAFVKNKKLIPSTGNLVLYFSKNNKSEKLQYGDIILIQDSIGEIKNSGNPGSFDNKRYQSFQQVYHTGFIKPESFLVLPIKEINVFKDFIFKLRSYTLSVLHVYISGNDKVLGIAEALLIGYKEDLDKELVQSYSNTGVVHIIAISGLHLGLIYFMLVWLLNRLPFIRRMNVVKAIIVIAFLWIFSFLTGAAASVLRSAVMFTCIVTGKSFQKNSSIENSLAVSAFILLCYNPYFLWDVGFQLSYLAIISIVSFQHFVLKWITFKQKFLQKIWELLAVTLAAQVLTFPVCLYYFHQFPNLFFVSNLIAVPLSTIILFAEILLIAFSFFPALAMITGKLIGITVGWMNDLIQYLNKIPFSVSENIYATFYSTVLIYAIVLFIAGWLIKNNKIYLRNGMLLFFIFSVLYTTAAMQLKKQKMIIVYNTPRQKSIDFIYQNQCYFKGEDSVEKKGIYLYTLKPSRQFFRIEKVSKNLPELFHAGCLWSYGGTRWMILDSSCTFKTNAPKTNVAVLLLSNNAPVSLHEIYSFVLPAMVVMDASNKSWRIARWKKECEDLHLPCFSVADQGAFVVRLS